MDFLLLRGEGVACGVGAGSTPGDLRLTDRARRHRRERATATGEPASRGGAADRVKAPGLGRLLRLPFPSLPPLSTQSACPQPGSVGAPTVTGRSAGAPPRGRSRKRGDKEPRASAVRAFAACGADGSPPLRPPGSYPILTCFWGASMAYRIQLFPCVSQDSC